MGGRKGAPRCRFLSGGNEATHKGIVSEHREESDGSGKDKIRLSVSSTRTNKRKSMSMRSTDCFRSFAKQLPGKARQRVLVTWVNIIYLLYCYVITYLIE